MSSELVNSVIKSSVYDQLQEWSSRTLNEYGFETLITYDPSAPKLFLRIIDVESFDPQTSLMLNTGVMSKAIIPFNNDPSKDKKATSFQKGNEVFYKSSVYRQAAALALGFCHAKVLADLIDSPDTDTLDYDALESLYESTFRHWVERSESEQD